MNEAQYSPVGKATASDIRNVTAPGLMLSIREREPDLLIFDWEGSKYALKLNGDDAFAYFPICARTPHNGLYIPGVEILVEFDSRAIGRGRDEDGGVLVLEGNQLHVVGKRVGDGWLDGQLVPLWSEIEGGSEGAKVSFDRWAIGIPEGNEGHRILWSYDFDAEGNKSDV